MILSDIINFLSSRYVCICLVYVYTYEVLMSKKNLKYMLDENIYI